MPRLRNGYEMGRAHEFAESCFDLTEVAQAAHQRDSDLRLAA